MTPYFHEERDQWFDDAGAITTLDFTGFANNETITDQYSDVGVTFEGTNFVSGPVPVNYHDSWGLRILFGNEIAFDEPIHAISADFLGDIIIELYMGNDLLYTSPNLTGPVSEFHYFGGLVSDEPFDSIRIYDFFDELAVLDDLHFGPPINVPAPSAVALIGVAAIFNGRRRRV